MVSATRGVFACFLVVIMIQLGGYIANFFGLSVLASAIVAIAIELYVTKKIEGGR